MSHSCEPIGVYSDEGCLPSVRPGINVIELSFKNYEAPVMDSRTLVVTQSLCATIKYMSMGYVSMIADIKYSSSSEGIQESFQQMVEKVVNNDFEVINVMSGDGEFILPKTLFEFKMNFGNLQPALSKIILDILKTQPSPMNEFLSTNPTPTHPAQTDSE